MYILDMRVRSSFSLVCALRMGIDFVEVMVDL